MVEPHLNGESPVTAEQWFARAHAHHAERQYERAVADGQAALQLCSGTAN